MNPTPAAGPLSPEQVDFFHREGYLVVPQLFTDRDLQPVIDEINQEIDRLAAQLLAQGRLSRTYSQEGFERRLAKISQETDQVARAIWGGMLAGPAFFNLIRHPKLLDVAEQFCGPELIASSVYRLRPKIPNYAFGAVPWHQDSGYTEPYCDRMLMLTVWLPLVDATEERGCMWVLPRAHTGAVYRHRKNPDRSYLAIPDSALPQGRPICAPVKKGGVLLLSNLTPHASFENRSQVVRWSMDLRYQSASLPTNAPITRLPHEAAPGAGVPPACYPPEADFLVRSRLRPEQVVSDPALFRRIRTEHLARPVTDRWAEG